MKKRSTSKRLAPVKIPLPFERAVEGLLAVDPKGPVPEKPAKKKAGRKK
jgi:hypothetical protein